MKKPWAGLRVAITGASSGIGAATAKLLAARGAGLALCARREDRLQAVAEACTSSGAAKVSATMADVGVLDDVGRFAEHARRTLGGADVVVANAGFGNFGNTLDLDPRGVETLVRTNVVGVLWTVQAFGPMLEESRGHAIVVGSVVGKLAVPYASVYSGTKWALRGWTRGARPELEARGISLTLVDPGYTRTEFFERRLTTEEKPPWKKARGMTAEQVGRRILRAIRRRPAEMEMTWGSRIAIPVYRLMPIQWPRVAAWFVRRRLRRP